ncbi:type II toxin-antitoxin system YafQ family toxin [Lonepinella sp. BR2474]|uniref:type II toxin-antitoxin system YafQ family toxin n=1 Tax=Lonepinella sp. BR2474 TaxID=3434548 RepID=UPI003F6DD30F
MAKNRFFIFNTFKKDLKKYATVFFSSEWHEISTCLLNGEPMPAKYRDHQLKGNLKEFRDCHLSFDLVLLYKIADDNVVELHRVGTHEELCL